MLLIYYLSLKKPVFLLLSYILQAASYYQVLRKMGLRPWYAFLPNVAEYKMCRKMFPKHRTFFRPFILAAVLLAYAYYVDPYKGVGILYVFIAFIVYGIFLARLYWRICRACGQKSLFALGLVLLPPVFLILLGRQKHVFTAPVFPAGKPCGRVKKFFKHAIFAIVSVLELLVIIAGCGYFAIQQHMPGIIIQSNLDDVADEIKDITADGELVTREDVLGEDLDTVMNENRSRDAYYPDHSSDQSVVVFVYMIGSDLEDNSGLASANISQMIDATKQGSGLKFIMEAGGSERWFTSGIKNGSYGRYEIADGKITQLEVLNEDLNMSEGYVLEEFLSWANDNYSADRNMLVLWDHGGGVAFGYGDDQLNGKDTMQVPDLAEAIAGSGMTFDIIGFDACLMQDIEVANALAPYADYYIASEETESGYGWYYTDAFGQLAQDPGMSSQAFGEELIACYDSYNAITEHVDIDTGATLSLVDLTLVESAYDRLSDFMENAAAKIAADPECFSDLSLAASGTYDFMEYQLDLVDFLNLLETVDYDQSIASVEDMDELIRAIESTIVCRNGASAYGINGIAFAFPYNNIMYYNTTSENLEKLSLGSEKSALDLVFSIIAAQKMNSSQYARFDDNEDNVLLMLLKDMLLTDYTSYDWYIEGFEDYDDTSETAILSMKQVDDGYQAELPAKTWEIITDEQTMVYQDVVDDEDGAVRKYIGSSHQVDTDENGRMSINMGDDWVYINGQLVCYDADQVMNTDEGAIYTGKVSAVLNGGEEVNLIIQWDMTQEDQPETGHVLGYEAADTEETMPDKGYEQLQAGDGIQFLFDYYDAEGNLIDNRTDGKLIRITDPDRLEVANAPLEEGSYEFGGVLTDVYQRVLPTEMVTVTIDEQND